MVSDVMVINVEQVFQGELVSYPLARSILADYCVVFHLHMKETEVDPSDLGWAVDHYDLISALPRITRQTLSTCVLRNFKVAKGSVSTAAQEVFGKRINLNRTYIEKLREEVNLGKCDLNIVCDEIVRTVFIIAVRISMHVRESYPLDGSQRFLVKVADVKGGRLVQSSCVLPGTKRREQESSAKALERFMGTDFNQVAEVLRENLAPRPDTNVSIKDSANFGVRTRYLRTTYATHLPENINLEERLVPNFQQDARIDGNRNTPPLSMHANMSSTFTDRDKTTALRPSLKEWWGRAKYRAAVEQRASDVLQNFDRVYTLPDKLPENDEPTGNYCQETSDEKFYLWMTDEEFKILADPLADHVMQNWLSHIIDHGEFPPNGWWL